MVTRMMWLGMSKQRTSTAMAGAKFSDCCHVAGVNDMSADATTPNTVMDAPRRRKRRGEECVPGTEMSSTPPSSPPPPSLFVRSPPNPELHNGLVVDTEYVPANYNRYSSYTVGPEGFLDGVKITVTHLLCTVLYDYWRKICNGCRIDHPSWDQHECLMEIPEFFYERNYTSLMNKLWTPHFIPSIQAFLEACGIHAKDDRIAGVAAYILPSFKPTAKITDTLLMSEQALVLVPPSSCLGSGHRTALHRAAMVGNSDAIAALIQGGCAVDLQDRDGNTALHEVSWHGFSQCVKLLVKAGADVHIRNKTGNTALHLACQNAHAQTARLLLLGGSTPDTKNNVGDTCLHVAARYNNLTLVKILLSSLSSVTERNQEGKTALDKARDNNHKDVALLLARAPQDSSSVVEETPSSEQMESRTAIQVGPANQQQQQHYHKTPAAISSPHSHRRRRRVKEQPLNQEDLRKGKNDFHIKKNLHCHDDDDDEDYTPQNGHAYQLYTLYRDKDGNIRQAPANGCHCKPLLKKLEGQLRATQEEMRLHILNVQEQVDSRLGKVDRRNKHQIKVLDMLNQERAVAERKNMIYRIKQEVARSREEALMTQAVVSHEMKKWCMSQLKDMDVHIPAKAQYYKLLSSPSVEQSVADADLESLPLLSVISGDSSTSLATYVNIVPSRSTHSLGGTEQEQIRSRTYFEMKVDRSP
eukprot:superscaffoldBa00006367_g21447